MALTRSACQFRQARRATSETGARGKIDAAPQQSLVGPRRQRYRLLPGKRKWTMSGSVVRDAAHHSRLLTPRLCGSAAARQGNDLPEQWASASPRHRPCSGSAREPSPHPSAVAGCAQRRRSGVNCLVFVQGEAEVRADKARRFARGRFASGVPLDARGDHAEHHTVTRTPTTSRRRRQAPLRKPGRSGHLVAADTRATPTRPEEVRPRPTRGCLH